MPRNDRSDSLSVRGEEDPRRDYKALEQEAEREMGWSEVNDTGGPEHQTPAERAGDTAERAPSRRAALTPGEGPPRPTRDGEGEGGVQGDGSGEGA